MKKTTIFWLPVIMLAFGLVLQGCPKEDGDGGVQSADVEITIKNETSYTIKGYYIEFFESDVNFPAGTHMGNPSIINLAPNTTSEKLGPFTVIKGDNQLYIFKVWVTIGEWGIRVFTYNSERKPKSVIALKFIEVGGGASLELDE